MASGKSTYWSNKLIDALFRQTALPALSNVYVALMTTSPGPGNTGVELSIAGYARVAVATDGTHWPAASAAQIINSLDIVYALITGTGPSLTVTSVALYDALTNGNLLWYGDLAAAYQKAYSANDRPVIPSGAITLSEA